MLCVGAHACGFVFVMPLLIFFLSFDSIVVLTDSSFRCGIQEHIVKTSLGPVSVSVFGDQDKPALITYPDLALNRKEMTLA